MLSLAVVDKKSRTYRSDSMAVEADPMVQEPDLSSEDHPKHSLVLPMRCLRTAS